MKDWTKLVSTTLESEIVDCVRCPRLVAWRREVASKKTQRHAREEYWGKPVTGFGDRHARVLAVGLAPGAHGSNRTGRQFTGDSSGNFLYPALHRAGFASRPESVSRDDGLRLHGLFLTAVCRCVPPGNKPSPLEIKNCSSFLEREIEFLEAADLRVIVALGRIAFEQIRRIYREKGVLTNDWTFRHGAVYPIGAKAGYLIASYHPSRQNTNTGLLTVKMFDMIWERARELSHGN